MGQALRSLRAPPPAFPPPPLTTARPGAPPPSASVPPAAAVSEIEQNRLVTEMLSQATITATDQQRPGVDATTIPAAQAAQMFRAEPGPLESHQLHELLTLHASDPERWTVDALAAKFSIDDHKALACALEYCEALPYSKGEDGVRRPTDYRAQEIRSPGFGKW